MLQKVSMTHQTRIFPIRLYTASDKKNIRLCAVLQWIPFDWCGVTGSQSRPLRLCNSTTQSREVHCQITHTRISSLYHLPAKEEQNPTCGCSDSWLSAQYNWQVGIPYLTTGSRGWWIYSRRIHTGDRHLWWTPKTIRFCHVIRP